MYANTQVSRDPTVHLEYWSSLSLLWRSALVVCKCHINKQQHQSCKCVHTVNVFCLLFYIVIYCYDFQNLEACCPSLCIALLIGPPAAWLTTYLMLSWCLFAKSTTHLLHAECSTLCKKLPSSHCVLCVNQSLYKRLTGVEKKFSHHH